MRPQRQRQRSQWQRRRQRPWHPLAAAAAAPLYVAWRVELVVVAVPLPLDVAVPLFVVVVLVLPASCSSRALLTIWHIVSHLKGERLINPNVYGAGRGCIVGFNTMLCSDAVMGFGGGSTLVEFPCVCVCLTHCVMRKARKIIATTDN